MRAKIQNSLIEMTMVQFPDLPSEIQQFHRQCRVHNSIQFQHKMKGDLDS